MFGHTLDRNVFWDALLLSARRDNDGLCLKELTPQSMPPENIYEYQEIEEALKVKFVPVCEKNIVTRRMENIFVRELTVKAADEMEIYETYRIGNEIWG
ncbi:hypothetical protein P5673_026583 [Acropora cervicornis]|uniref:Uncharacterized protein n=1 Tax=Acropora cervicornis TaxID=6130 RepID=A0AAD9Q0F4_ACRCE|nr:hypothetical protein P5673_026583 [Acropora cervicornis]